MGGGGGGVWSAAAGSSGRLVAAGGDDGVVSLWDVRSGACAWQVGHGDFLPMACDLLYTGLYRTAGKPCGLT